MTQPCQTAASNQPSFPWCRWFQCVQKRSACRSRQTCGYAGSFRLEKPTVTSTQPVRDSRLCMRWEAAFLINYFPLPACIVWIRSRGISYEDSKWSIATNC